MSAISPTDEAPPAGHRLLWALLAVATLLALARPQPPAAYLAFVDWPTIGALAGLLAVTHGIERSGYLQPLAARLLARAVHLRALAFLLCGSGVLLGALVTNDVSLFLLVPLTRALARQARLPLARLVALQALAVNAGSSLTPIGNPQNLLLWHRSGLSFTEYVGMMAPSVAVMLAWLALFAYGLFAATPVRLQPAMQHEPRDRRLLHLSLLLFVAFVVALERPGWWPAGLVAVLLSFAALRPRLLAEADWMLLVVIALMFVVVRQVADIPWVASTLQGLPLDHGWHAFAAAVVASQAISNVPATILLHPHVQDLRALAAGVNVGGFGLATGSLATLIALRLARTPGALMEFHRIGIPFLIACALTVVWLHH